MYHVLSIKLRFHAWFAETLITTTQQKENDVTDKPYINYTTKQYKFQ